MKTFDRRMMMKSILGAAGAAIVLPHFLERAARADAPATTAAAETAAAPKFPFDTAKIEVEKLSKNLALITGPGGNIAVHHGPGGILVVDCGVPSRGKDLLDAIKLLSMRDPKGPAVETIADGPLKILINTHWHFDHTGGNELFAGAGATIVAHENTYKRLSEDVTIEFFNFTAKASPENARPNVTFDDKSTMRINGETIIKMAGEKTKIIPGHGPLASVGDVKKYRDMLVDVQKAVKALIAAGKTEAQAIAAKPTAAYDKDWGGGMMNGDVFTKLVYTIEKKAG